MAKKTQYKVCLGCKRKLALYKYFSSKNPLTSSNGKMNICKECITKLVTNPDGTVNLDKFQDTLRRLDKPFVPEIFENAVKDIERKRSSGVGADNTTFIGTYFRILGTMPQYRNYTALDSSVVEANKLALAQQTMNEAKEVYEDAQAKKRDKYYNPDETNVDVPMLVTEELRDLFGEGLTYTEYRLMKKKYDKILENYTLKTSMHEEFLIDFVKFKVKEEMALSEGDIEAVKKWSALATTAADNAKLTPKQLTAADLQGGVNTFGEIFEAVESAKDVIPILPRFKQRPNDMVDFIIWNFVNYERDLNGMPKVSYEDIYKFYDERVAEYLSEHGDPFGIFENDPSRDEKNRATVRKFIAVEKNSDDDNIDNEDVSDNGENTE